MWSAGTISVASTSAACGSSGSARVARLDPLARRDGARPRPTSWAWIGTAPYAARNAPLPKVWSKCSWVLTTATTSPAPSRRTSSTTLAGRAPPRRGCRPRAGPASPPTSGDVDVEPVVPGHPDPVRDLGEVGHARRPYADPAGRPPTSGSTSCASRSSWSTSSAPARSRSGRTTRRRTGAAVPRSAPRIPRRCGGPARPGPCPAPGPARRRGSARPGIGRR